MDLLDIRDTTRKLLREHSPSRQDCERALPLCKTLWESFPETRELWDAHQYANCLRRLNMINEAELVCDTVYREFLDKDVSPEQAKPLSYIKKLYAWVINDKYVKGIRNSEYQYSGIVLDKILVLCDLIQQGEQGVPSLSYCVVTIINQLSKSGANFDYSKALFILNQLEPSLISSEPSRYTDNTGKEIELASQQEIYYTLKSDALFHEKMYEECIVCCNEAIENIAKFHYGNDVWFERKVAMALGQLGQIDDAVEKLKKLVVFSDKWFLLSEIGKLYLKLNAPDLALEYMLRALCTKDPEKMKVKIIELLGDILSDMDEYDFAQENYICVREIREANEWFISEHLKEKIKIEKIVSLKEIRKKWIDRLYCLVGSQQGKIAKTFSGGSGFIQSDKSYYFQYKNFFGKTDLIKVGDKVTFIVVNSYDKKKQVETEEAMVITPLKTK